MKKHNLWKRGAALALALTLGLSLTACAKSPNASESSAPAASDAPQSSQSGEKVLNVAQPVEMDTLDIGNMGDGYTTSMASLLLETLFRTDANNQPAEAACSEYTVSEDGLTYTFTLRDMTWSNGDPVTAADFEYCWKRTCDPANGFENAFLFNYVPFKNLAGINAGTADISTMGVTALDGKTLQVELDSPCSFLIEYLSCHCFGAMNQSFVESCGDQYGLSSETFLTNGAFELTGWTAGDLTWTIKKSDSYWDAASVKLDEINYQVIKDTQTGIMAYESGTVDYTVISSDQVDMYKDSPDFFTAPTTFSWYVVPNFEVEALQNINLRYALGFAIDREALVNNILADGSLAKYDINYSDVFFDENGTEFNSVRPDFWSCDKAKAAEYWETAKQELGVDSLELKLCVEDTESAQNVAVFIQSEVENACPGLTIKLQVMPKTQRLDDMEKGNYELALHRTGSSVPYVLNKPAQLSAGHVLNYGRYDGEEYNALYQKAVAETDPDALWDEALDLEELGQKEAIVIPVYRTADCLLIRPNLKGYIHNLIGTGWDFKLADFVD